MMAHAKSWLLIIRLVCAAALIGLTYYEIRHRGYIAAVGFLGMLVIGVCISYNGKQARKLAEQNMRKYGLEPGSGRSDDLA